MARTISLTLDPPVLLVTELNSRDHWLEISWTGEPAEGYELELLTQSEQGAYRIAGVATLDDQYRLLGGGAGVHQRCLRLW